jgi:hypothetical protein
MSESILIQVSFDVVLAEMPAALFERYHCFHPYSMNEVFMKRRTKNAQRHRQLCHGMAQRLNTQI